VSAASDFISETDLLKPELDANGAVVKDSVKDFLSAGLKGADSTCGCNTAPVQRIATLNYPVRPMRPINMVETAPNKYTAESFA